MLLQELLEQELEITKEIQSCCLAYKEYHEQYLDEVGKVVPVYARKLRSIKVYPTPSFRFFDEVESLEKTLNDLRWLLHETRIAIHNLKQKQK